MDFPTLNWLAVVLALVLHMVLGFVWYMPAVFGKKWQRLLGMKDDQMGNPHPMTWPTMIIGEVLTVLIVAVLVKWLNVSTLSEAAVVGVMLGLLHVSPTIVNAMFGGMGKREKVELALIDSGYVFVAYVLVSLVLTWWK